MAPTPTAVSPAVTPTQTVSPAAVIVHEGVICREMVPGEARVVRESVRVAAMMSECVGMSVAAVPTTVSAAPGITQRRG